MSKKCSPYRERHLIYLGSGSDCVHGKEHSVVNEAASENNLNVDTQVHPSDRLINPRI